MATGGDLQACIDMLYKLHKNVPEKLKTILEEANSKALVKSAQEILESLPDKFKQAMKEGFYDAYPAPAYGGERRYSLFNVLQVPDIGSGSGAGSGASASVSATLRYDGSGVTFRGGGSGLFEQVFDDGYHGGAQSGKPDRAGRVVSGYHYRYPKIVTKNGSIAYPYWGSAAAQTESPYQLWEKKLEEYSNDGTFQQLMIKNLHAEIAPLISSASFI